MNNIFRAAFKTSHTARRLAPQLSTSFQSGLNVGKAKFAPAFTFRYCCYFLLDVEP